MVDVNADTPAAGYQRSRSLTPAAKLVTAKGSAVSHVIAQLTELAVAFGATWLCYAGRLSEDNLMIVFGAVILGPAVGKMRGVVPAASVVTLLALAPIVLPWLAKRGLT